MHFWWKVRSVGRKAERKRARARQKRKEVCRHTQRFSERLADLVRENNMIYLLEQGDTHRHRQRT